MTDVIDHEAESNSARVGVSDARLQELVDQARAEGLQLTGDGGLLAMLTKLVVESALEGEMDDHLGYGKNDSAGRDSGNSATADAPRPCCPRPDRLSSPCPVTGIPPLSRRS
ncbi:hypothetical protein CBI38_33120 (plasmid) [Rhodococcus oxybenzonivorans]|uniref:Transposase n=1 Tax=Rhodococcus oxybenzonivorans TaxID=1990687 RepID=A0A2S2C621_9NOCA|nr:hypothetical protein CBI38_33120 [Rhodococcus oxybenzonivorans]